MAYFNYYIFKKIIREIVNILFRFIKKHKNFILFLLIYNITLLILFLNNNVFAIEYLEDSYPEFDIDTYVSYNEDTGIYSNKALPAGNYLTDAYCILYSETYSNFNIVFFTQGMEIDNTIGNGRFIIPVPSSYTGSDFNYFNLEYSSDGSFFRATNNGAMLASFDGWWQYILYSTVDIYDTSGNLIISGDNQEELIVPIIKNTDNELSNLNFQTLNIDPGTYLVNLNFRLINNTTNERILDIYFNNGDYDDYLIREDEENPFSNLIYKIPLSSLPNFKYISNNQYNWQINYDIEPNVKSIDRNITSIVNFENNSVSSGDINSSIKDTNEKLENIEGTITDSNVEVDVETDLPSVDIEDPTQTGIDNIFNSIYNAFCTGDAKDIVFPIPYTEKNIVINPYYVRDMLNNSGASWVYTFIQAFWSYIFGRFIIKDISNKINKIKSGDIDNIQNTNIKEDML